MKASGISPNVATALVVANMIGTGVFTTSGLLLEKLGSPGLVLLAWLGGGITALLGALCYGALARQFPESGGEYAYLSHTLPGPAAFVTGWITLIVGFAVPLAALAFAFAEYLRPWLPVGLPPRVVGTAILVLTSLLHWFSISAGAKVQAVVVAIEVILITLLASFGLRRVFADGVPSQIVVSHPGQMGVALILVSYSYVGWNGAAYIASEVRDASKTLPRVFLMGTLVVTALYLALNAFFVYAAPVADLAGRIDVGHIAAEHVGGPGLTMIVSGIVALAVAMCVSALTMTGPQLAGRMAADGLLPKAFRSRPGQPPRLAIVGQLVLGLLALWTATFDAILTYVGVSLGLCTGATVWGLIRLRRRQGSAVPVPGWPWVPALFLLFMLGATAWTILLRPREGLVGIGTVVLFAVLYWVRRASAVDVS